MLLYLTLLSVCFLLSYIIGNILFELFFRIEVNYYSKLFFKTSFGFIFFTVVFSLFKTNFISINLVFLIFLFYFWIANKFKFYKKKLNAINFDELKILPKYLLIIIIFYSWRYFTLSNSNLFPVVINMDSLKHVIRSAFLINNGIESVNVNYLLPPKGIDPYHYFEAWTIGFWGSLFNIKFWISQQLIVFPLISTLITMGFWGIVNRWNNNFFFLLISFPIVFITGIYSSDLANFKYLKFANGFEMNAYDEWKGFSVSFAYLFIMIFLNLLISNVKKESAILTLLFLPIISINIAPTTLLISSILIFILYFKRRKTINQIQNINLFIPFFIAALIFLFYKIFESKVGYIKKPGLDIILRDSFSISFFKARVIIIIEKLFQGVLFYSPFLLILIIIYYINLKNIRAKLKSENYVLLFSLILFGLVISTFIWQLLFHSFGASQFLFYTMIPFVNILSALILFYAMLQVNKNKFIFIGLHILLTTFYIYRSYNIYKEGKKIHFDKYSNEYISCVVNELSMLHLKYGLKIEDKQTIIKFNDTDNLVGEFLTGYFNDVFMFSYTKAKMYIENDFPSDEAEMLLPKAPLISYVKFKHKKLNLKEIENEIEKLIHNHKIGFILTSESVTLPGFLKKYVKKTVIDKKSKESFHKLFY